MQSGLIVDRIFAISQRECEAIGDKSAPPAIRCRHEPSYLYYPSSLSHTGQLRRVPDARFGWGRQLRRFVRHCCSLISTRNVRFDEVWENTAPIPSTFDGEILNWSSGVARRLIIGEKYQVPTNAPRLSRSYVTRSYLNMSEV